MKTQFPIISFPFIPFRSPVLCAISIHSFPNHISATIPMLTNFISITLLQVQFYRFSLHISLSQQLSPFTPIHTPLSQSFYYPFIHLSFLHTLTLYTLLSLYLLIICNNTILSIQFTHFILQGLRDSSHTSIPSFTLPIQH